MLPTCGTIPGMTDPNRYAQLITSDPEFVRVARSLDAEALRVEIKYAVAGLAAADYRHSSDEVKLPDLEAITSVVTEIVFLTLTLGSDGHESRVTH